MKRVMLIFTIILVITISACAPKDQYYQQDTNIQTDTNQEEDKAQEKYISKHLEIRFGDVIDMIVYQGDLYFLRTDESKGAVGATIHKYVDEKTPPIKVFGTNWTQYADRLDDLYTLEEYNEELYAAGPLGMFKLNKNKNMFEEIEFSYGFIYNKKHRVTVNRIKTIHGKLYGLLNYAPDEYGIGLNLAILEGETWKIIDNGHYGIRHVEEYNNKIYGSDGRLYRIDINDAGNNEWQKIAIPEDEYGNSLLGAKLKTYNGKIYACNEIVHSTASIQQNGSAVWTEETSLGSSLQDPESENKKHCEFIDTSRGKLFIGTEEFYLSSPSWYEEQKQYNPNIQPPKPEIVESLHMYDGKEWKKITFPGLSPGQAVTAVRAVEEYKGKTYIAVETNFDNKFETQPSFYTLEDTGKLTPVTWWQEE